MSTCVNGGPLSTLESGVLKIFCEGSSNFIFIMGTKRPHHYPCSELKKNTIFAYLILIIGQTLACELPRVWLVWLVIKMSISFASY